MPDMWEIDWDEIDQIIATGYSNAEILMPPNDISQQFPVSFQVEKVANEKKRKKTG